MYVISNGNYIFKDLRDDSAASLEHIPHLSGAFLELLGGKLNRVAKATALLGEKLRCSALHVCPRLEQRWVSARVVLVKGVLSGRTECVWCRTYALSETDEKTPAGFTLMTFKASEMLLAMLSEVCLSPPHGMAPTRNSFISSASPFDVFGLMM